VIKLAPIQKPYYPRAEVISEQLLERISQNKNITRISKILLINPLQIPSKYFDESMAKNSRYFCYPPYGLGIVAKIAKSQGFDVEILDLNFKLISSPEKQADVKKCIRSILESELNRYQPNLVGITCMFTITHESFKDTVQDVRALMPKVLIVAGGVHITNDEMRIKKDIPEIDFTLTNESEFAFIDLLNMINRESKGGILTAWCAISNINKNSGGLCYLLGSHTTEEPAKRLTVPFVTHDDPFVSLEDRLDSVSWRLFQPNLNAGDVIFHHGNIWHGSTNNLTSNNRCSISVHLMDSEARFSDVDVNPVFNKYRKFDSDETDPSFFPICA